jgi:hypothetical protein
MWHSGMPVGKRPGYAMTIDTLPCDVLLDIFHFDLNVSDYNPCGWRRLVHVCQRWRQIIFASPLRLNLRIYCKPGTPVRKNLDIWPTLPICIEYGGKERGISSDDEDNIIAALEHPDRLSAVRLHNITGSQLGNIAAAMQRPYPILTCLEITSQDGNVPVLPSGILGGSAPQLREITLFRVPFPALPTLLLSASDLVDPCLNEIPPTGYISPDTMVARLAALSRLKTLLIEFEVVTSHYDRSLPPPITRAVLPSLNYFVYRGLCEYLEDLVARIDTPQLDTTTIVYCDLVDFDVTQLSEFINRSEKLKKTLSNNCVVMPDFENGISCGIYFSIAGVTTSDKGRWESDPSITICVSNGDIYQQILALANVLRQIFPILPDMVHFYFHSDTNLNESFPEPEGLDDIEWLQVLRPFSSVQTLFVCGNLAGQVCRALDDIDEEIATRALPAFNLLCAEDQPVTSVDKFITVRRDFGRPVTVVNDTSENFETRLDLYYERQHL